MSTADQAAVAVVTTLLAIREQPSDVDRLARVLLDVSREADVVALGKLAAKIVDRAENGRSLLREVALEAQRPALGAYRRERT